MSDEVRVFAECATCEGSGISPESPEDDGHGWEGQERLSCQDCRGTGAGREMRLRREWVCQNNPFYLSSQRCLPTLPHSEAPEYPVGSGNRIGCGWYLREVTDGE